MTLFVYFPFCSSKPNFSEISWRASAMMLGRAVPAAAGHGCQHLQSPCVLAKEKENICKHFFPKWSSWLCSQIAQRAQPCCPPSLRTSAPMKFCLLVVSLWSLNWPFRAWFIRAKVFINFHITLNYSLSLFNLLLLPLVSHHAHMLFFAPRSSPILLFFSLAY